MWGWFVGYSQQLRSSWVFRSCKRAARTISYSTSLSAKTHSERSSQRHQSYTRHLSAPSTKFNQLKTRPPHSPHLLILIIITTQLEATPPYPPCPISLGFLGPGSMLSSIISQLPYLAQGGLGVSVRSQYSTAARTSIRPPFEPTV